MIRLSQVLAAVGILAVVLVALILPAFACGCKVASKTNACLSNAKQQVLGLLVYASDHDDRLPPRDLWMDATARATKTEEAFHDPEARPGEYGYAFNAALSWSSVPEHPERTPLTYDSANPIRNASDLVTSLPKPGRHKGRNAIAYADGHVKALKP